MIKQRIYTSWYSKEFNSFGKYSQIGCSLNLLGGKYISIGENVSIGKLATLTAWDKYGNQFFSPSICIGNGTNIGEYVHISAINKILIGSNVLMGRWVTIVDNAHGNTCKDDLSIEPILRPLYSKGNIIIGDNVWIGDKATILSGVKIGENSIIGANSVVINNVPENSIAVGCPAKIISIN